MSKKKSVEDYEYEARSVNGCLVHKTHGIARKVYQMRHGALPSSIFVCHTCDNPKCILDAHHFPGTHLDNMKDAQRKGHLKRSPEVKAQIAKTWSKAEIRLRKSEEVKARFLNADERELQAEISRSVWARPGMHAKLAAATKRGIDNPAARLKMSQSAKAQRALPGVRESMGLVQRRPDVVAKKATAARKRWSNPTAHVEQSSASKRGWETRRMNLQRTALPGGE